MFMEKILSQSIPLTSETVRAVENHTIGFITLKNHRESAFIARKYLEGDEWASKISYVTNVVDGPPGLSRGSIMKKDNAYFAIKV